ncbi:MAG: sulfotransferase [Steroidobacteraceae bacterium]
MMKNFDVGELLRGAERATGLSDFGPDDFRPGLEALVNSMNAHGSVSDDRWQDAWDFLLRLLKNRLWFAQDLKDHPGILDQQLLPPVTILPLPRTGSTKLQRMLDASDSFQPLLYWRMFMFARIPGLKDGGAAERLQETKDFEKWLYAVCPDYIKGHPIFAEEADEEQILNRFTFRAPILTTMFYAPEATRWIGQSDLTPMYHYLQMQLKYLQWQFHRDRPRPWLLKSPTNVGNEDHLVEQFGREQKFICPHRDPVNIVCSIVRTSEYTSSVYSDILKRNPQLAQEKARRMMQMLAAAAEQHIRWRERNPDIEILDLSYEEINRNSVGVLRKVYDFLDLELTPQIEQSVLGWEQDKERNRFARNSYASEEFGLSDAQIREAFKSYVAGFSGLF